MKVVKNESIEGEEVQEEVQITRRYDHDYIEKRMINTNLKVKTLL